MVWLVYPGGLATPASSPKKPPPHYEACRDAAAKLVAEAETPSRQGLPLPTLQKLIAAFVGWCGQ